MGWGVEAGEQRGSQRREQRQEAAFGAPAQTRNTRHARRRCWRAPPACAAARCAGFPRCRRATRRRRLRVERWAVQERRLSPAGVALAAPAATSSVSPAEPAGQGGRNARSPSSELGRVGEGRTSCFRLELQARPVHPDRDVGRGCVHDSSKEGGAMGSMPARRELDRPAAAPRRVVAPSLGALSPQTRPLMPSLRADPSPRPSHSTPARPDGALPARRRPLGRPPSRCAPPAPPPPAPSSSSGPARLQASRRAGCRCSLSTPPRRPPLLPRAPR